MTVPFRRPPRLAPPPVPTPEVELPPPAPAAQPQPGSTVAHLLPAVSGMGSVGYLLAGPAGPAGYVAGSALLLSSLGVAGGNALRAATSLAAARDRSRLEYLCWLGTARKNARRTARGQRALARWQGPAPEQLWSVALGPRLWERRRDDPDFGHVRVGVGTQPLATRLTIAPEDGEPELFSADACRRFVDAHRFVHDLPTLLPVLDSRHVLLDGDRAAVRSLVRAMLLQAATFHSPADLVIAICTGEPDAAHWSWVKWLPHAQAPTELDASGTRRLVVSSTTELLRLLADRPGGAHLLLVLDGGDAGTQPTDRTTVVDLDGCGEPDLRLTVESGRLVVDRPAGGPKSVVGRPDTACPDLAVGLARQLARFRPESGTTSTGRPANTLPALLGVADLDDVMPVETRTAPPGLRTPIGRTPEGAALVLDIKEAAQGGMGPHGLVIGATGSGKSELLRTLVLGMATTHSSEVLNLVLVDFKGGATFAGMADLPHVAAVITNLENDLPMVDRMREALSGELNRRQEVLRAAGNLVSVRDYDRARAQGAALAPLPSLWVVVDEFSELLAQKPDFSELFDQMGRLGRSLGVHLLLASQRIDEGRLRGLESHLSYRIGLRTFSESESRAVLGVPDAYTLPSSPGHGYLRADTSGLRRFRAAYVSGAHRTAQDSVPPDLLPGAEVREFTASYQPVVARRAGPGAAEVLEQAEDGPSGTAVLDVMVGRLVGQGEPAHRVWLPPLDEPDTLDRLLPDLATRPGRGFGADPAHPALAVPVGIVDLPYQQRRDPFVVDLSGAAGNVAVVGGPRSGKSTLLRSVIAALALRHTSEEVQFYCLDFSGGALFALAGLPHVGGVAGRRDGDVARRIVAEISALVDAREARFRDLGVDTMARYLQARLDGRAEDPYGEVFLVVDGWAVLRQDFEDLEIAIMALTARALTYGVHLVLTANRWLDLRLGLRDIVGGKLELKLGDALDSEIDRRAQEAVPAGRPGRGITPRRAHYLGALPRIDGVQGAHDLTDGIVDLVERIAGAWTGPVAPPVRLLPTSLSLGDLAAEDTGQSVVLGMEGLRLRAVELDPRQEQGLVVLGDAESGKTSLLRAVARQVLSAWQPSRAKVVLIDFRRSLLGEFGGDGVLSYAATAQQAVDTVAGLVDGFTRRLPGSDVTPEQLRTRSWWTGPDIYVLVDDYDLVTSGGNPLLPLVEFLPQARDLGLHLIVARRAGGAGRAVMDPVIGGLRELGQPAVVLSAPSDEGTLFGVRPGILPVGRGTLVSRRLGAVPIQLLRARAEHR